VGGARAGEAVSLFGGVVDVGGCVGFAARAIDPYGADLRRRSNFQTVSVVA